MEEELIYQDTNVTITRTRLMMNGKTYVLKNISSVEMAVIPPNNTPIVAVGIITLILFWLSSGTSRWMWLIITAAAAVGTQLNPKTYSVRLSSTSGEVDGLKSKDQAYIMNIVSSLNHAITLM